MNRKKILEVVSKIMIGVGAVLIAVGFAGMLLAAARVADGPDAGMSAGCVGMVASLVAMAAGATVGGYWS